MKRWTRIVGMLGFACLSCPAAGAFDVGKISDRTIENPFVHCREVKNDDAPRRLPAELNARAADALEVSSAAVSGGYFWRCMDEAVYVCTVGANLPCLSQADRARRNPGADAFCRDNPDAEIVPAYATGHRTIFEWRCVSGKAMRGKVIVKLDRRGFQRAIWRRLKPNGAG